MKRHLTIIKMFMLYAFSCSISTAIAADIDGQVTKLGRIPVVNAVVIAEGDDGSRHFTTTDAQGFYAFKNLTPGYYTVWLEEADEFEVEDPVCGFHYQYVQGSTTMNYAARTIGVMVDFGDPSGGSGFAPSLNTNSSTIEFSVYMYNLDDIKPDRVEIVGYWYAPGQGPLDTSVVNHWQAGSYVGSNLVVDAHSLGGFSSQYTMEKTPFLSWDGEVATYRLQLTKNAEAKLEAARGQLAFCGTYIRMFYQDEKIYDSQLNWVGNKTDFISTAIPALDSER